MKLNFIKNNSAGAVKCGEENIEGPYWSFLKPWGGVLHGREQTRDQMCKIAQNPPRTYFFGAEFSFLIGESCFWPESEHFCRCKIAQNPPRAYFSRAKFSFLIGESCFWPESEHFCRKMGSPPGAYFFGRI